MVHLAILILTGIASRLLFKNRKKKKKKAAKDLDPLSRLIWLGKVDHKGK